MRIRTYTADDLNRCRELWVELTQQHRDIYEAPEIGGDDPGLEFDKHLEMVGAERIFLAVVDNEIVGLVGLIQDEKQGEVEPIIVSASCRGRGYGEQLLRHVIEVATKVGMVRLSIRPVARNLGAISFFYNRGFKALGKIEMTMPIKGGKHLKAGPELFGFQFDY